jgi:hypothetical protein
VWHLIQHWLAYMTGSANASGTPPNYNFYSGFGSDLAEITIIGGLVTIYRKHNCEVKGCHRLGRHTTDAGHHVCRRHMPGGAPTHADVLRAHRRAQNGALKPSAERIARPGDKT